MIEFVKLTCPSCGGKLEISKDINQFACAHCGNEHRVVRRGGLVSLNPVEEDIAKIEKNTDLTASELAIKRLKQEIPELEKQFEKLLDGTEGSFFAAGANEFYSYYVDYSGGGFLRGMFTSLQKKRDAIKNLSDQEIESVIKLVEETYSNGVKSERPDHRRNAVEFVDRVKAYGNKLITLRAEIPRKKAQLSKFQKKVDSTS